MLCKICGHELNKSFQGTILGKYPADYYQCPNCDFLSPAPITWLEEAYQNPINLSDTGYLSRNLSLSRRTFILFKLLFGSGNFLDYAGGYGVLTRLMRDFGLDYYWSDKYTNNLFAVGFEYKGTPIKALTCFECFEHLENPSEELDKILDISHNIFFSTSLIPERTTPDASWWYYGFSHGQHIAFYSRRTLQYLADRKGLFFYSNGSTLHFFSERKINSLVFQIVLKLGVLPWDILARFFMRSRTFSDSQAIIADQSGFRQGGLK